MPTSPQAMITESEAATQVFDTAEREALRREWLTLVDLAVWGSAQSQQLGALPQLRKRVVALGAPRGWIARPRERLRRRAEPRMLAAAADWARQLEASNAASPED